jgi:hypothetical protein
MHEQFLCRFYNLELYESSGNYVICAVKMGRNFKKLFPLNNMDLLLLLKSNKSKAIPVPGRGGL